MSDIKYEDNSDEQEENYILAVGNLFDGFSFYGPFDSFDLAELYCEINFPMRTVETWIGLLTKGKN